MARKIFISHASEDRVVVEDFVHLLEDGLGVRRAQITCSSLPGYGFDAGSPFEIVIRDHVRSADAFIALISTSFLRSGYCMAEVGLAWGFGCEIVPLMLPQASAEEVVRSPMGRLHLMRLDDAGALDGLLEKFGPHGDGREDFIRWQDRRDRFLSQLGHRSVEVELPWARGFWNGWIVDGALYISEDLKSRDVREQLVDALLHERPVPPHLFYVTDSSAKRWIDLAQDPRFEAYQDSMQLIYVNSDDVSRAILAAAKSKSIDVVSLGPGDGRKDAVLLRSLLQSVDHDGEIFYYPFDISTNMIVRTMAQLRGDATIRNQLSHVKAINGDFDSLSLFKPVYRYGGSVTVLLMLGNTLGNFADDLALLRRLNISAMSGGDLMLLEVRLQSEESASTLQRIVDRGWAISDRFDFGPLELLGTPYDPSKLFYTFEGGRGTIRGSDTLVARYSEVAVDGRRFRDVELSYVHRYDYNDLVREVERVGFAVVTMWFGQRRQVLWILIRKPGSATV